MRILLGISWDIIDIMGINGVYFNGTIWYHINSFFSQPLLVTAQNEQNKHVSCSGQSQFVITAKHRGPTVFLLLGSKTHPWKVSIRGRSLRNNTMLQRDFKRSCKVVHPPKVYEATSFYPLAGENLPCNTDLRWEEPATPEHCSSFLCLFGVLDAVLIRAQARSCNTRSASGPKWCPVWSTAQNDPGTMRKTMENMKNTGNYFTSSDPHPDTLFWHGFWHTIWKYNIYIYMYIHTHSDILSDILSGLLSGIYSDILSSILFDIYSDILSGILSDILSGLLSGIYSDILSSILFDIYSDILFGILAFSLAWVRVQAPSTASWARYIEIRSPSHQELAEGEGKEEAEMRTRASSAEQTASGRPENTFDKYFNYCRNQASFTANEPCLMRCTGFHIWGAYWNWGSRACANGKVATTWQRFDQSIFLRYLALIIVQLTLQCFWPFVQLC